MIDEEEVAKLLSEAVANTLEGYTPYSGTGGEALDFFDTHVIKTVSTLEDRNADGGLMVDIKVDAEDYRANLKALLEERGLLEVPSDSIWATKKNHASEIERAFKNNPSQALLADVRYGKRLQEALYDFSSGMLRSVIEEYEDDVRRLEGESKVESSDSGALADIESKLFHCHAKLKEIKDHLETLTEEWTGSNDNLGQMIEALELHLSLKPRGNLSRVMGTNVNPESKLWPKKRPKKVRKKKPKTAGKTKRRRR